MQPNMRMGIAMAMLGAGALAVAAPMEPAEDQAPPKGSKPSGSKPVPGGGARERARRLARMSKQQEQ